MNAAGVEPDRGLLGRWWRDWGRSTVRSGDLVAGAVAGLLAGAVAMFSSAVRAAEVPFLYTEVAVSIGLLATVLASLSVAVIFMTGEYAEVLQAAPRGVHGAFFPFQFVAWLCGATALLGLIGAVAYPACPWGARALVLCVVTGLCVWAVVGTVMLVGITAQHGAWRLRLLTMDPQERAQFRARLVAVKSEVAGQ